MPRKVPRVAVGEALGGGPYTSGPALAHLACNGRVALDTLRASPPGVIVLDLMMPEMDGFEFVAAVRGNEAWRNIPIVVVTAKDLSAEDHQRLNGYVDRVMQKSATELGALLRELAQMLPHSIERGHQTQAEARA